jgi:chromosome segregation ATPase
VLPSRLRRFSQTERACNHATLLCDFSCPFRHDRDLAFYAEQDKKHEDERRLAAENQREWESRVAELERLLVESRTKCDEQVHLLAAACEERDTNAADSKAARADAAREHDARALAEHERDELAALLAKMREQLKTLQDQLHDVEAERDALRRECAGLKEEVAKLHDQVESMEKQRDSLQKQIKEASASASKETEEALAALRLKIKALQDQLHAAEEARDVNAREAAAAGKRCSQAEQALAKSTAECEDLRALVAKLRTQLAEKTAAAEAAVSERDRVKAELSVTQVCDTHARRWAKQCGARASQLNAALHSPSCERPQGRLKAEIDEKTRAVHERDAAVREHKPCAGLIADLRRQLADLSAQRALPPTPPAGPPRRAGVGLLLHQDEVSLSLPPFLPAPPTLSSSTWSVNARFAPGRQAHRRREAHDGRRGRGRRTDPPGRHPPLGRRQAGHRHGYGPEAHRRR